jgi:DNA-binding winged helix-turn-helix (wHTH) protein
MNDNLIHLNKSNISVDLDGMDGILECSDHFTVNCRGNEVFIHHSKKVVNVSEKEKRLLVCLMSNVNKKQDIINVVWHENPNLVVDNQYHQLVYKLRRTLLNHELPHWIIKTICRYGVRLNAHSMHHQPVKVSHDNIVKMAK